MTGFWIGMLIFVLIVVGLAVIFGMMLNRGGGQRRRGPDPRDPMTALKASGALRHRKSNRP